MPTQGRTLAKNRRQIIEQHFIDGQIGSICPDQFPGMIVYYGKTTDATPTELFINGKLSATAQGVTQFNRLYLPESTLVGGRKTVMQYNATDDTFGMGNGFFAVQNLNGTTAAAFDLDKSGSVNNAEINFDIDATTGDMDLNNLLGASTLVIGVDDTTDFLSITATGIAAKVIYWKVYLEAFSINEQEVISNFFFGDRAAQVDGD